MGQGEWLEKGRCQGSTEQVCAGKAPALGWMLQQTQTEAQPPQWTTVAEAVAEAGIPWAMGLLATQLTAHLPGPGEEKLQPSCHPLVKLGPCKLQGPSSSSSLSGASPSGVPLTEKSDPKNVLVTLLCSSVLFLVRERRNSFDEEGSHLLLKIKFEPDS